MDDESAEPERDYCARTCQKRGAPPARPPGWTVPSRTAAAAPGAARRPIGHTAGDAGFT
ncbi:hypothetical protein [Streptomyces winkii]|uniref:hypothetical protein n=1 Tax=Streptomyces winkii TaxID=3051178 RepID=UPI0028D43AD3|nr:hypothetical protein [Streptomyces sp. DSM 40971]